MNVEIGKWYVILEGPYKGTPLHVRKILDAGREPSVIGEMKDREDGRAFQMIPTRLLGDEVKP